MLLLTNSIHALLWEIVFLKKVIHNQHINNFFLKKENAFPACVFMHNYFLKYRWKKKATSNPNIRKTNPVKNNRIIKEHYNRRLMLEFEKFSSQNQSRKCINLCTCIKRHREEAYFYLYFFNLLIFFFFFLNILSQPILNNLFWNGGSIIATTP